MNKKVIGRSFSGAVVVSSLTVTGSDLIATTAPVIRA